jgi:A/G-specific adenine glycosylase
VLVHWAGLGYYARARNLHRAAQVIVEDHGGAFPLDFESVAALPGIGRSTAAAILSQADNQRHAILDGNVKRVLARWGAVPGWPGLPKVQAQLWTIAESLLPGDRFADYTQAIMDLGASVCTSRKPSCHACPVSGDCRAFLENRIADFPGPKPKRARPLRHGRLILIERGRGEWMVERRPPVGIWGGLWCPPIVMDGEDWAATLSRYGLRDGGDWLPTIHHGFTHFDLELLPVRMPAPRAVSKVAEPSDRAWIKLGDPEAWPALPSPLRKLFEGMARQGALPLESMT